MKVSIKWAGVMNVHGFFAAAAQAGSDQPRIVITGREEILIEQHRGLFSYETKCIRIRTGAGLITVKGEQMVIAFFGAQDLLIRGQIISVDLDGQAG